jgi:hypothetical protein
MQHKCFAVEINGAYWVVYAESAEEAKGMVLKRERLAGGRLASLRCRRWAALDINFPPLVTADRWGEPGTMDRETGSLSGIPTPFEAL